MTAMGRFSEEYQGVSIPYPYGWDAVVGGKGRVNFLSPDTQRFLV